MAYPIRVTVKTTSFGLPATTHNVDMPATVNADDWLIAILGVFTDAAVVTTPSGWTAKGSQKYSGATNTLWIYAKIADGTEGGGTVNFASDINCTMSVRVHRISGAYNSLSGLEVGFSSGSATTSPDAPSLNPSTWDVEDTLWIAVMAAYIPSGTVTGYPSGYSGGSVSNNSLNYTADAWIQNTVASEDPGAFTSGTAYYASATIAIKPFDLSLMVPLLTNTPTLYGPELTLFGLLVPPFFENTPTFYAPNLAYEQLLVSDLFTNTPTFYDPTFFTGNILDAPLLTNTPTFYAPEFINTQILTPALFTNTPTLYAPEFRGPQNIATSLLTNTPTFYGPEIFTLWGGQTGTGAHPLHLIDIDSPGLIVCACAL